jgi:integrase
MRHRAAFNRKKFTEENVLKIPAKRKQYLTWDAGTGAARGLAILSSPTGTKSYRVVFYWPGSSKPNYKHIGRVGEISLADARKIALESRGMARKNEDPRAGEANKSDNFKVAIEDYIQHEQVGRHKNTSALQTQKLMLACLGEELLKRPVATIRFAEIDALLELMRDGNSESKPRPYQANRLYSHLKDFFSWCVRKKKITASPMADMRKPFAKPEGRKRDWFKGKPADKAITSLWAAADKIGGNEGRYLKMLLLTGKRKSALALMRWEEIDDNWFWDAPPGSKNKRLHAIPLPKKASEVLHPRGKTGKVFGELKFEPLQAQIRKASGLEDFFFHGVRHLLESKLAELKIPPHIRDLLFDHAPNRGTGSVYDHHEYRDEMFDALNKWADYIDKLRQPAEGVSVLR